ncbi:MAG: DNA polymerase IV [Sporomusaceae bacterium]|nr:DNA polymerase IV [Sporomusaceae bacterium]
MQRWIMHVDMDAFFASVEQRDHPELRGKPVIVGGCGARGVVATASYEARQFGVRSAMPAAEARRRCPHAIFLPSDHRRYAQVSRQIRRIMDEFSPLVEPLSLDEAFLDLTGMELLYADPAAIARRIKERICLETGLTASAGIAPNKFLAKVASDLQKPDGLVVVRPEAVRRFLAPLPVSRLWGVGAVTAKLLREHNINTIGQLAAFDLEQLEGWLGNVAADLQDLAKGRDERPVVSDQAPKSVGNEETYEQDIYDPEEVRTRLLALAVHVGWRLRLLAVSGRTLTLKLRYRSFKTVTRSRTLPDPTCLDEVIFETAWELAQGVLRGEGIRLLGITVSNLSSGGGQCSLFDNEAQKKLAVAAAVDKLREKFGSGIVSRGRLLPPKPPQ